MTCAQHIGPIDLLWLRTPVITIMWPVDQLESEESRARFDAFAATLPRFLIGTSSRAEEEINRKTYADLGDINLEEFKLAVLETSTAAPASIAVLRSNTAIALIHSHAIGDGNISKLLFADLIRPLDQDSAVLPVQGANSRDLCKALVAHWRQTPGGFRTAISALTHRTIARIHSRSTSQHPEEKIASKTASETSGYEEINRTTMAFGRVDADKLEELKNWRQENAPGASLSLVLLHSTLKTLTSEGFLTEESTCSVMVNLRRYSPILKALTGNLIGTVGFKVGKLAEVDVLATQVKSSISSAEPLLLHLLNRLRRLIEIRFRNRPYLPNAFSQPGVSWSDRGRVFEWENKSNLGWLESIDTSPCALAGVTPSTPGKIAFNLHRVGDAVNVACTFSRGSYEEHKLKRLIAQHFGDPLRSLDAVVD